MKTVDLTERGITMKTVSQRMDGAHILRIGAVAGLAGGLAEIVWISGFMGLVGGNAAHVASEVTLGLIVHMGLALGLGVLVAVILRKALPQLAGTLIEAALLVAVLGLVWATNFFVVLPVMNPDFVHIVPLPVSFVSKILFGVCAAAVMWASERRRA